MATSFTLEGKVAFIGQTRSFASGFTVRELQIDTAEDTSRFSNTVVVELHKNRCSLADELRMGDYAKVSGYINGRFSERSQRVWNTLEAVRIEREGASATPAPVEPAVPAEADADDSDQMPF